jgi:hypothetical protein
MSILRLDYQRTQKPLPSGGIAVLVVALAVLAGLGARYYWLVERADELEVRARTLQLAAPAGGPRTAGGSKGVATLALEIRQANEVLRQLGVPWDALFLAVEAAGDKDVTLLSMEPDGEKQSAKIVGEAKNMAAVLNYLRQLGKQPVLHDINLQHHQIQLQDAEKPVRFTVLARWEIPS